MSKLDQMPLKEEIPTPINEPLSVIDGAKQFFQIDSLETVESKIRRADDEMIKKLFRLGENASAEQIDASRRRPITRTEQEKYQNKDRKYHPEIVRWNKDQLLGELGKEIEDDFNYIGEKELPAEEKLAMIEIREILDLDQEATDSEVIAALKNLPDEIFSWVFHNSKWHVPEKGMVDKGYHSFIRTPSAIRRVANDVSRGINYVESDDRIVGEKLVKMVAEKERRTAYRVPNWATEEEVDVQEREVTNLFVDYFYRYHPVEKQEELKAKLQFHKIGENRDGEEIVEDQRLSNQKLKHLENKSFLPLNSDIDEMKESLPNLNLSWLNSYVSRQNLDYGDKYLFPDLINHNERRGGIKSMKTEEDWQNFLRQADDKLIKFLFLDPLFDNNTNLGKYIHGGNIKEEKIKSLIAMLREKPLVSDWENKYHFELDMEDLPSEEELNGDEELISQLGKARKLALEKSEYYNRRERLRVPCTVNDDLVEILEKLYKETAN